MNSPSANERAIRQALRLGRDCADYLGSIRVRGGHDWRTTRDAIEAALKLLDEKAWCMAAAAREAADGDPECTAGVAAHIEQPSSKRELLKALHSVHANAGHKFDRDTALQAIEFIERLAPEPGERYTEKDCAAIVAAALAAREARSRELEAAVRETVAERDEARRLLDEARASQPPRAGYVLPEAAIRVLIEKAEEVGREYITMGVMDVRPIVPQYIAVVSESVAELRDALTKKEPTVEGALGELRQRLGLPVETSVLRDCECGDFACMGPNRAKLAGLKCKVQNEDASL